MIDCPIDGCEYSAESEGSVVGHMSSSKGDHEGIGYSKARQMLSVNGDGDSTDGDTSDDNEEPDTEPSDGAEGDPAAATPDNEGGERGEPDCPDCGGELVDYRVDGRVGVDYVCSECEAGWVDE